MEQKHKVTPAHTLHYFLSFNLLLFSLLGFSQTPTVIKGVVTDVKTGEPIPFVNITEEGVTKGTTTDFYGQYLLQTYDTVSKLVYTNISYKTETRKVDYGK